jgi:hypothetical protein
MLVKFEFGDGLMITDRVIPLELWKKLIISQTVVFNSNLTYGYFTGMCRSSSNLVMFWWFLAELCPLTLKKKEEIFSFCSLFPQQLYIFNSNLTYGYVIRMRWSTLNLVMVWWFLTELSLLNFERNKKFLFIISQTVVLNSNLT